MLENHPKGPYTLDVGDMHVRFDRINAINFRKFHIRKIYDPVVDRTQSAWGYGKKKTSVAVAQLKAGSGQITINGKPLLDYFLLPKQRYLMMIPL
jgi:hypothetical protein